MKVIKSFTLERSKNKNENYKIIDISFFKP